MAGLQLLGQAERKVIAREIDRLRKILVAIDQMEQCGTDCTDSRQLVTELWNRYNKMLKALYQESPDQPPWQEPSGTGIPTANSSTS